jgi:drug/metabolite transporter (DMT)-like permease
LTETSSSKFWPYAALGFAIFALGVSPVIVRLAGAPGPVASFYRLAIAVVVMAVPFARERRGAGPMDRRGLWLAVAGGLFFALDMAAWCTGVMLGSATTPTLLANTAPMWVGLGAMLLFKERLNARFWLGLVAALAGAALVMGVADINSVGLDIGALFGLLAGIFYGGYFLFVQRGRETLSALSFFWVAAASTAVSLLVITQLLGQPLLGYSLGTWLWFLLMGLLVQAGGYYAVTYAQGHLPASLVSPTLLGQPVVTATLAALVLAETFSLWQIAGGVAVLGGVLIVHRSRGIPRNIPKQA